MEPASYAGNYKTAVDKWKPLASLAGDYARLISTFSFINATDKSI